MTTNVPCILTFAITLFGLLPVHLSFYSSVMASLSILFILGYYLGRLSERNTILSGAKIVVAGVVVAMIALIVGGH